MVVHIVQPLDGLQFRAVPFEYRVPFQLRPMFVRLAGEAFLAGSEHEPDDGAVRLLPETHPGPPDVRQVRDIIRRQDRFPPQDILRTGDLRT